ncbi:penicillin acylase family protein [Micromonosporaceae bacterium B7E4]
MKLPRSWPPRLRRTALWGLATVTVLAVLAGLVAVWAVRRPFPRHGGELTLAGLSAPVTVYRDANGIPQLYAETAEDLFRAQGYVHAQDRFWEMDLRRRVTSGRLAELFGKDLVGSDMFLRTLGWRQVAEAEWALLSPETQRYLTAYADGVNAWIEQTGGSAANARKALQYALLDLRNSGYRVEPWVPVDSLAWLKATAWDLRGNMHEEQNRAVLLAAGLTRAQVAELFPDYPYATHAPAVTGGRIVDGAFDPAAQPGGAAGGAAAGGVPAEDLTAAAGTLGAVSAAVDAVPYLIGGPGTGIGSNAWVVSGALTESGAPILTNDPHLGVSMPGPWYQMGLHCACGYQVAGFTFAGLPGVMIGHNARIAWALTNLGVDATDLYLERIDGDRYQVDGEWRDLRVREETIRVAGGDDVIVRVRQTHRGPLLSPVDDTLGGIAASPPVRLPTAPAGATAGTGDGYAVSLAWTGSEPGRGMDGVLALNQAGDWKEFRAAVALSEAPAQNVLYADADGNIGYQASGRVPVRETGDGEWVSPGWDSTYDWQGQVAFAELPHVLNPPSGRIVSANQPAVGPQYQRLLSGDWPYGYRSDRIHTLLDEAAAAGPISVPDMERMLFDNRSAVAPILVPALLAAAGTAGTVDRGEAAALDLLRGWDFQQPAGGRDSSGTARSAAAAAYFNAAWRRLMSLLFDELPATEPPGGGDRWMHVLRGLLAEPGSSWWDRPGTPQVEGRDAVLALALSEAYTELVDAQGDDPQQWRWGRMHTLTLREPGLGESGIGMVEALFNRGPVETAGGTDAVNANGWYAPYWYGVTEAPSMRMVIDMSDVDNARWIQLTGNSGHAYHPNYADQLDLWRTGRMLPWHWSRPSIVADATHTLVFTP